MDRAEVAHSVLQPHFDAVKRVYLAAEVAPGLHLERLRRVHFLVDPTAHDTPRHYAATSESGLVMRFAPEMVDLDWETAVAIMAHEFGHAADFAYPACFSWPKARAGASVWVGDDPAMRAQAWRASFGKASAKSRQPGDDEAPATNWAFAWHRRTDDQVEWAADAICELVTQRRVGYAGPCMLQRLGSGQARPAGLR